MSPVEEYFFNNNINVWSRKISSSGTYYNTSDGEYLADHQMNLYKVNGNLKELIEQKKEPVKKKSQYRWQTIPAIK